MQQKRQKSNISTRIFTLIGKARGLSVSTCIHDTLVHRRHKFKIDPAYKSKPKLIGNIVGIRPASKLLRNTLHHVPKYKIERHSLDWVYFSAMRSTNQHWRSRRITWVNQQREIKILFATHLDNNFQPHWWQI